MKSMVNFYIDDLKPQKHYFTAINLILVCIFVCVVTFMSYFVLIDQVSKSRERLTQVEGLLTSAQSVLTEKQQALIKHNDKATFSNLKVEIQQKLESRKQLWNGVGKRSQTSSVDYYRVMDELTKHHSHELWLSQFLIDDSSVAFIGYALSSKAVTQWMTYLQAAESFKGREFSHLVIQSTGKNVVRFEAATSAEAITTLNPAIETNTLLNQNQIGVADVLAQ